MSKKEEEAKEALKKMAELRKEAIKPIKEYNKLADKHGHFSRLGLGTAKIYKEDIELEDGETYNDWLENNDYFNECVSTIMTHDDGWFPSTC